MLDKKSRIILDTLITNNLTYPQESFQSLKAALVPLLPDHGIYNWTADSLSPCISYLIEHEYVDAEVYYHGYYPVADYRRLYVTYKGSNYREFERIQLKDDMFKSLVLPIAVSLITSLIVTACGYIWTMAGITNSHANTEPTNAPTMLEITDISVP